MDVFLLFIVPVPFPQDYPRSLHLSILSCPCLYELHLPIFQWLDVNACRASKYMSFFLENDNI